MSNTQEEFWSSQRTSASTGLSESTHLRLEAKGQFPKRYQLSPNRVARAKSEVLAWIEARKSDGVSAAA